MGITVSSFSCIFRLSLRFFRSLLIISMGALQNLNHDLTHYRFGKIFNHAQVDGFLGIVKFVVGGDDDELYGGIEFTDLPDSLNAVDSSI